MTTPKPSAPEVVAWLDEARDQCSAYKEPHGCETPLIRQRDHEACIEALQRRVAELEADAARYRWLRDYDANWRSTELVVVKDLDGGHIFTLEELDAAIDAARGERDALAAKEEK